MKDAVKRIRSSEESSILLNIAKSIVPKPLSDAPNVIPLSLCPKEVTVRSKSDWDGMIASQVEVIVVEDNCCNESEFETLDLSGFVSLKKLTVGNGCFKCVKEVKVIGLKCLESVVIGEKCFLMQFSKQSRGKGNMCHFYLKRCSRIRELRIGKFSFADFSLCEIENVDALEVIEIGELDGMSANFFWSSLELKSVLIHRE